MVTSNLRHNGQPISPQDRRSASAPRLIGAAFRGTATTKSRQELIILMCPQVTLTKLDLYRLRQKWENTNTHFGPELDQAECPDCPKMEGGKQLSLPPPDLPDNKDM